jgi:hypothetical protein
MRSHRHDLKRMSKMSKHFILAAVLASASMNLWAQQGGTVTFGNNGSSQVVISPGGNPVVSTNGVLAALYWSPIGSNNFVQIGASTSVAGPLPGIFAGGTRTTGTATPGGATGQFQVRAWGGGFATYEQAVQNSGVLLGQSAVIQAPTGNPTGTPPTPPASLMANGLQTFALSLPGGMDIGLRAYDGSGIIKIAAEPQGQLTSPVRISKNGTNYGILLVATNSASASRIRVQTSSGVKAWQKLP